MSNRIETLGQYIRKALDVNRDGQITFKDFLSLFPNNAIAIAVLFVDAVVLVAEYRVWDVGIRITNGDPYKALGFVLVSAVPFYLGQLFWLYPRAVNGQKVIAVGLVAGGLYTSAMFGLADLSQTYDIAIIVATVVRLTVIYVVAVLFYILIDPGIKAHRAMTQARAAAGLEREYQQLTREMLSEWQTTKALERETVAMFDGDEDAVIAHLETLRGKKNKGSTSLSTMPSFASENASGEIRTDFRPARRTEDEAGKNGQYPVWKLDGLLDELKLTREQALKALAGTNHHDAGYNALKPHGIEKIEIGKSNFNNLYYQLKPRQQANP